MAGADLSAKRRTMSTAGFTPLHYAAGASQIDALKELVRLGARIDARDDDGGTALLHAVAKGCHPVVIDTLLELGADVERADKVGMTALESAAMFGNIVLVRHLLSRGARATGPGSASVFGPLVQAVEGGKMEVLEALVAAGSPVDPEPGKYSALGTAALKRRLDMVQLLLRAGADPNHRSSGKQTPLMDAVRGKSAEVVRRLVQAGADVNAESDDGMTVLDRAIQQADSGLSDLLREAGAKANRFRRHAP